MKMADYVNKIQLPTRAKFYAPETNITEEITIRNIKTKEEKILYGSTGDSALDMVIQNIIVEPKDIKVSDLITVDKHYILMQARILTYGSDYHVQHECDYCGSVHDYILNLDEFPVHYVSDDFEEPFVIELPDSKAKLECKLLRGTDLDLIQKKARRHKQNFPDAQGDITYIFRMMRYIVTVNGEKLPEGPLQSFVENMSGKDSAYFWHYINNEIKLGVDTMVYETCKTCRRDIEFPMPLNAEFFRPRFR